MITLYMITVRNGDDSSEACDERRKVIRSLQTDRHRQRWNVRWVYIYIYINNPK